MTARRRETPVSMGSPRFDTLECGPFLVTDARFPAGQVLPRHYHDRTVVGITLRGAWDSVVGATRLANAPGTLHVEPAGEVHANHFGAAGARVLIVQPDPLADMVAPLGAFLGAVHQSSAGARGLHIAERLRTEIAEPDELSELAIESLCLDLLVSASRAGRTDGPAPRWLLRSVEYLHAHFLDRPRMAQLAAVAGVSPAHLARHFRCFYHASPAEYVRRLRLDWAANELRRADRSVAEVASAAGFADQSHFTRLFRRHVGETPAAFRALARRTRG